MGLVRKKQTLRRQWCILGCGAQYTSTIRAASRALLLKGTDCTFKTGRYASGAANNVTLDQTLLILCPYTFKYLQ